MNLVENDIYHIYNRGNNRQQVFFKHDHYRYFIFLIKKTILQHCDLLAWCLMPNHFHFLIHANASSIPMVKDGSFERQQFSQDIKQLLSTYTKTINHEMNFTGSRFQQKTKCKDVSDPREYALTAFWYVHQNPLRAGLVHRMEDWEYSSFREYSFQSNEYICNKNLAADLLDLDLQTFFRDAYQSLNDELIQKII